MSNKKESACKCRGHMFYSPLLQEESMEQLSPYSRAHALQWEKSPH